MYLPDFFLDWISESPKAPSWTIGMLWFACLFFPALLVAQPPAAAPPYNNHDIDVYQRLESVEAQLSAMQRLWDEAQFTPAGNTATSDASCNRLPPTKPCHECAGKTCTEYPTFKVTGFFQLDGTFYNQDSINRATLGDIEDGLGFRRARLAATGNVSETTTYIMEFDMAQGQGRFVDVWMQFAETPLGNLRIGRYRQPFGMAELTGIRELPFLERPLQFALSPFRQTGMMLYDTALDERLTWAVSAYRYLSDNFGNVYADTGGYGLATRVTLLPVDFGDERLVHLGFDYSYNDPGHGLVQYVSTNESFVGQNPNLGPAGLSVLPIVAVPPFVDTGEMPTQQTNLFNVEGAVSFGRILIRSEARWAVVDQPGGVRQTFPGAYAHVRYVLTGETIPYNRQAGVFGRVKPFAPVDMWCGQWGAWEIAARVSYLDLNGTGLPGPGRRLTDTTVGLNWYVNDFTKFQFNWIHADLSDPALGDSNADTLALRGQIDF